ncbi:Primosomal replication protein N'''' [Candidatus Regiella insecticola 5.15]|uniref:Primosomal replication protein N n=1 Tax=Candidatus Regiella insecticola 5.15 TaxID=1005043 RepID=G2GZD7_9ENTR|nr:Primosomal replication protein N'''' [Candidatus Regiella insecticola 5.15]
MKTEQLLTVLTTQIEALSEKLSRWAIFLLNKRGLIKFCLTTMAHGLRDYLLEVRKNLAQLKQVVAEQHQQQVAFLAEKLVAQVAALQRELATQMLRKK